MKMLAVMAVMALSASGITLVEKGKSAYTIVVSGKASPSEQRAARELQRFIEEMSGAKLAVVTDAKEVRGPKLLVGDSLAVKKLRVKLPLAELGAEGFVLRTKGADVIIAGGRQRGTMYGATAFLERLGCRWFTSEVSRIPKRETIRFEALEVMDEWMLNLLSYPELGVVGNKPPAAVDRCFDETGNQIAAGEHVWDGILDSNPPGACTQQFKLHSTSRIVAGGPIRGGVFKCQLIPVSEAITRGFYGDWTPSAMQQAWLIKIFPQGVCDYSQPDAGLPPGW